MEDREGGSCAVVVPTQFQAQGLTRYISELGQVIGRSVTIEVKRAPRPAQSGLSHSFPRATSSHQLPLALPPKAAPQQSKEALEQIELLRREPAPRLVTSATFDAAHQLAKNWTQGINQGARSQVLWVHGRPGSGKSHLCKQFNEWISLGKRLVIVDVMAFFAEWRKSLDAKDHMSFIRKYRKETDVLVLENIDEFITKKGTAQEALYTISALLERGASVAVTSAAHPVALRDSIEPALFSRLFGGLAVELSAPDRSFKENLWRELVAKHGLAEMRLDVMALQRLMALPVDSIRRLNSLYINAIGRISIKASLDGRDLCELESLYQPSAGPVSQRPPLEMIDQVAKACGVARAAIVGKSRRQDIGVARRFVCLALSRFCGLTNVAIANILEKDPSTICQALRSIEADLSTNRQIQEQWNWLCSQVGHSGQTF